MKVGLLIAGLLASTTLLAQTPAQVHSYATREYKAIAQRYVALLEQEHFGLPPYAEYQQELAQLSIQQQQQGFTKALALDTLRLLNEQNAKIATALGLQVMEMDDFLVYFFNNKARYITPDSPLHRSLILNNNTDF